MPPESRLAELHRLGQSPWFDYINRALIQRGGLKKMVDRDGLGGVTSNPAIFERSIGGGREYDEAILTLARQGMQAPEILDQLIVDDVRAACDVLAPVYLASGGEDGFVSIEVSPHLARDAQASAAEAHRLFTAVDRPNVFVKIPGTREGIPAILQCLKDGLNINSTLLFSLTQYEAVADAYLEALEHRLQTDETIRAVSSVASFFVSRVDTLVDELLEEKLAAADEAERRRLQALKGRAGVANARDRLRALPQLSRAAASGSSSPPPAPRSSACCWASTGVTGSDLPRHDVRGRVDRGAHRLHHAGGDVEGVQGPRHRGAHRRPAIDEAHRLLRELGQLGIDLERVGAQLQEQGVDRFVEAFDGATRIVEEKRVRLLAEGS